MGQLHNGIKYGTDLVAAVNVLSGVDPASPGVERLSESLTPILDPYARDDEAVLRREHLWGTTINSPAVAAEFSITAVVNPLANQIQGLILVVTKALFRGGGAAGSFMGWSSRALIAATLTQVGNAANLDSRFSNTLVPRTTPIETWAGSDGAATLSGNIEEELPLTPYSAFSFTPIMLKPGTGIYICAQTVNTSLQTKYRGYYRMALPGELPS